MARTIGAILDRQEELKGVVFDIVLNRQVTRTQQITRHKVENGSKISDHRIIEPIVISFRAEIGNISLFDPGATVTRAQEAYDTLKDLKENNVPFDYQTDFELFENMLFTTLTRVEDPLKSGALIVDIVIEEIRITESEQVLIPKDQLAPGKTQAQLTSEVNKGQKQVVTIADIPAALF